MEISGAELRAVSAHADQIVGGAHVDADAWTHVAPAFTTSTTFGESRLSAQDIADGIVKDASGVVTAHPAAIHHPTSVGEIQDIVSSAAAKGRRVTIAGTRHSGGGQALQSNTDLIDMRGLDGLQYDAASGAVNVQPGATWEQVQRFLDPYGKSMPVQQSSNVFSVGGSIATNIHGRDVRFGPLVDSVESVKVLTANGVVNHASRTENPDLFASVFGGYGQTGIVTEARMRTVDNERVARRVTQITPGTIADAMRKIAADPDSRLLQVRLPVVGPGRLRDAEAIEFRPEAGEIPAFREARKRPLLNLASRTVFRTAIHTKLGKRALWFLERHLIGFAKGATSRNQAMAPGVEFLRSNSNRHLQILHEYFLPPEQAQGFLDHLGDSVDKHDANLLNVTLRWTPAQQADTTLDYAGGSIGKQDTIAAVLYLDQRAGETGQQKMDALTRDLAQDAVDRGGSFYLPYQLSAFTPQQLDAAYPQRGEFFDAVKTADPNNIFGGAIESIDPATDGARAAQPERT